MPGKTTTTRNQINTLLIRFSPPSSCRVSCSFLPFFSFVNVTGTKTHRQAGYYSWVLGLVEAKKGTHTLGCLSCCRSYFLFLSSLSLIHLSLSFSFSFLTCLFSYVMMHASRTLSLSLSFSSFFSFLGGFCVFVLPNVLINLHSS